jgi:hypothetical protein
MRQARFRNGVARCFISRAAREIKYRDRTPVLAFYTPPPHRLAALVNYGDLLLKRGWQREISFARAVQRSETSTEKNFSLTGPQSSAPKPLI